MFTLSANSYRFCLQLDFLLFKLRIANSGNYLHLRIIVHYKIVITYWVKIIILIKIAKWISPYWDNKSLPTPTLTLPDTLSSTFRLFTSLLLKIYAFATWYLIWKGREKSSAKCRFKMQVDHVKKRSLAHIFPSAPLVMSLNDCL